MFSRLVVGPDSIVSALGPDSIVSALGSLARTSRNPKALVHLYRVLFCPVTQQHTNSPVVLVESAAAAVKNTPQPSNGGFRSTPNQLVR